MLVQNDGLQTFKLEDRQLLYLAKNVICLNYIVQIQYYLPIFGKLHNVLLKCETFFKGVDDYPMVPTAFKVSHPPNFSRSLWLYKLNDPFSRRSSNIPDKSKLGNGYFFSWSYFSMRRFLVAPLKGMLLFSSSFDLPVI